MTTTERGERLRSRLAGNDEFSRDNETPDLRTADPMSVEEYLADPSLQPEMIDNLFGQLPQIEVEPGYTVVWLRTHFNGEDCDLATLMRPPFNFIPVKPDELGDQYKHLRSQNITVSGDIVRFRDLAAFKQSNKDRAKIILGEREKAFAATSGIRDNRITHEMFPHLNPRELASLQAQADNRSRGIPRY